MAAERNAKSLLIIGGSGFVSGTIARRALSAGWQVSAVTRGTRPLAKGVRGITADRTDREAFARALADVSERFDLVVDSICYNEQDAAEDIDVFSRLARRLVFISTDSVYDPAARTVLQDELDASYVADGYGGGKRAAELAFLRAGTGALAWTILRPCHIYGPGSLLGCIPRHARDKELLPKMLRGETLTLVGGGRSLQQPLFVDDLADAVLACEGNRRSIGAILNVAGPRIIETRRYFEIIAETLGVPMQFSEEAFAPVWDAEPNYRSYLCHRVQSMERLAAAGLPVPTNPPEVGLPIHVKSILEP